MIFEPKRTEIITIVAMGASCYDWVTANYQNFALEDEQVWTINAGAKLFRHDVVWDMHTEKWLEDRKEKLAPVLRRREWMKTHDRLIVMPYAMPAIPMSRTFPLKSVIQATHSNYFSGGLSYPLAMAYMLKPITLRLFGTDFSYDRDKATHPDETAGGMCCAYWIGRIKEAGIRVEITSNTYFMDMHHRSKGYLYGYHQPAEWSFPSNGEGNGTFIGPDYTVDQQGIPTDVNGSAPVEPTLGQRNVGDIPTERRGVVRPVGNGHCPPDPSADGSGLRLGQMLTWCE